jgi:O-acetyl-ADP-ribose deacetylase (regulator of RNase III)
VVIVEVIPGRLSIITGDISLAKTQAVVNAANTSLWMGSGVAGALKARGGDTIEKEAIAQGPIPPGGTVLTSGGNLFAEYVIHVATMKVGEDATTRAVRLGTMGALALAKDNRIDSMSFPALGTGVGGVTLDDCAHAMLPTISRWLRENDIPGEVRVVLFRDDDHKEFLKMWDHLKIEGEL